METLLLEDDFGDYDENEDDELDLYKLVSTDSNDLNQYLVFSGSNDEWYAMNVSKIEEVIVFDKSLDISYNNDKNNLIFGTADIRNSMTPLIYFDQWYGNAHLEDSAYELMILASYGGHKFGIVVNTVSAISIIEVEAMSDNSQNNLKSTFIAKVLIEGKKQMCTIYDGDQMLLDIFDTVLEKNQYTFSNDELTKVKNCIIYFADDSRFIRKLVEELFCALSVEYKIFNDGRYLMDYVESHPNENIDLFITDLEMPNMGGRELIVQLRKKEEYGNIPILVHTNMSNNAMESELLEIGATDIISKINMIKLGNSIIGVLGK
ncbi:chemotaxis protein CheV [Sulfurimonas sp. SAG-AH-194-C21]|nr:chemotaxis protein CheV [Sulfurimonas sp. SAG-AH-194-C21]MDF1884058.1 chemotaxis protein CheV [Sulfurimonas sp. SAG-AH-194-C21]